MTCVQFNVGGTLFTTSRETAVKEPTSRLAMMVRGLLPTSKDEASGAFFVDRDPKHFQLVLNYLRDGCCVLPLRAEERREVLQEVRHYQMPGMEAWMRTQEMEERAAAGSDGPSSPCTGYGSPASCALSTCAGFSSAVPSTSFLRRTASEGSSSLQQTLARSPCSAVDAHASLPVPCSPWSRECAPPAAYSTPAGVSHIAAGLGGLGLSSPTAMQATPASCTSPCPASPGGAPARSCAPALADDGFRWTGKYLRNNGQLRDVVTTLLELAHLPPHEALHGGRTSISISVACDHDKMTALLGSSCEQLRGKRQIIRVEGAMGWTFEFCIRPSSDPSLFGKYCLAEYVQDNWFVLQAVLKDQFGVLLEEDTAARPPCVACRRTNLAITMSKLI